MAYLNKAQYDRRRENAAARNLNNEQTAVENGMTQEQAELISELCSMRHDLHCNVDRLVNNNAKEVRDLIELNIRIMNSGLNEMEFVPIDTCDFFDDIDSLDELFEIEDVPTDDDERQDWYDEKTAMIHSQWESLNSRIESYLKEIDKKYGTTFAPTGALRVM